MQERGSPVRVVQDTSKRIVPRQECRQQRKKATCLLDRGVDFARGIGVQICDAEEEECHVEREEQGEESDGRAESCQKQEEGEDEPALQLTISMRFSSRDIGGRGSYDQEESERVPEGPCVFTRHD